MSYLAHISKDHLREQTILEHSQNVASLAAEFAKSFNAESWGYCCGLLHDIGKYTSEFQERLKGGPSVDHATAAAKELADKKGYHTLAAYCVAGHHAGLPDGGTTADDRNSASLKGRLKKRVPDYQEYKKEIKIPDLKAPAVRPLGNGGFMVSFFLRMIYSCLVDADFLDTEDFMNVGKALRNPERISQKHLDRLLAYVAPWMSNTDLQTVNGRRTEILKHCLEMGKEKPGLFSLTVPTGGGKTISSLSFALQQACTYGKERIIYVIPYTSIIEQNAAVFRSILGEETVLECHSNVQYDNEVEYTEKQLAAENFDKPVIVTTNVQFFESLFANRSSKCRKLHNLTNSVIIFDETQMLPVPYLKPCIAAIAELAANYQSTVVMCTATQPALQKFFPDNMQIREICPAVQEQFEFFRRTKIENLGTINEAELQNMIEREKSVLCILNNRKRVQRIYKEVEGDGVFHLSTYMYPEHRKQKLKEIRKRLDEGKRCVVISTSLVEAGVDLDFEKVYRELSGVDSVVQAAGRCNREGTRNLDESVTYVFQLEEKAMLPAEQKQAIAVAQAVTEQYTDISSLEAINSYFNQLHYIKGNGLDQKEILERFARGASDWSYPFASVAKEFKLLENQTKMIVIGREEDAVNVTERLRWGERSRQLLREAGQYSVQVYENDFEKMRAAGYLEELDEEITLLRNMDKYTNEMGIEMDVEYGEAVFF